MKRYRLRIPEKTLSIQAGVVAELNKYAKNDWIISYQEINELERRYDFMVPSDWLEEIPDEPMSPEEWVSKHFKNENAIRAISYDLMVEMLVNYFKAGAAEERKKFKPLIDAVLGNEGFDTLEILARSLKAHNLPEEE